MKGARNFVLRIDFDVEKEAFIVTMPPSSFKSLGEPEKVTVEPENFRMLSKDQMEIHKFCVYQDAKTGTNFATVERGLWYN